MRNGMRRQAGHLVVAITLLAALAGCVVAPYGAGPGYHHYYHDHDGYNH
jgi:hypothetical protein